MSDAHAHLCRALLALTESGRVASGKSTPWVSATFVGMRHAIGLSVPRRLAAALADSLPEHEFDLPGHLVADLEVAGATDGEPGLAILRIEALTIETT